MLDLNYISPKLMNAQNLEVVVPGTYDGTPNVSIPHHSRNPHIASSIASGTLDKNSIDTPPAGSDHVKAAAKENIHERLSVSFSCSALPYKDMLKGATARNMHSY